MTFNLFALNFQRCLKINVTFVPARPYKITDTTITTSYAIRAQGGSLCNVVSEGTNEPISKGCLPATAPQIITKMPGRYGKKLRRVTYFVSMCGKERNICTSDWTRQPIIATSQIQPEGQCS